MKIVCTRTIIKATVWRFIATTTTGIIAYFVTGKMEMAASIFTLDFIIKFVLYYIHEKAWERSIKNEK